MPRSTLQDVYNSRIPAAMGDCAGSSRLIGWANEATQRLLSKGLWWGTYAKYNMAAYGGIITMPPQLSSIESVAINHQPIPFHDLWFEFIENGFGTRTRDQVGLVGTTLGGSTGCVGLPEAQYVGVFPTFRDLTPNTDNKKVVIVCDLAADVTAAVTVTVMGHDQNGNWIRTLQGGVYADGEVIALAQSPGTTSVNYFSDITDVRFSAPRAGQCWLYELDTVTSVQTLTGWYQYFENQPSYQRYLFQSIFNAASTCTPPANWQQAWTKAPIPSLPTGSTCNPTLIEVVGKLAFIPVVLPTDYLIIGNIPALKSEMVCIKKLEDATSSNDVQEALAFEQQALQLLDDELDAMLGTGRKIGLNIQGCAGPSDEIIPTLM